MKKSIFLPFFLAVLSVLSVGQNNSIHMFLPGRKGAIEMRLPQGYHVKQGGLRPDGKQFKLVAEGPDTLYMTAFVEVAPRPGTSVQVRDDWYGGLKHNSKMKMENETLLEKDDAAIAAYTVHEYQGMRVEQRSVHAYYGGEDIWSEIHVSKTSFKPADQKLFDELLSGVKYIPNYTLDAWDEFLSGTTFYEQKDYKVAALHYQKALDLEKQKVTFEPTFTHVLIDQLGMSYGISNDLEKSREVLEYGISKDPDYPLYYYNIACGYGEKNDKANALAYLKKAFERKANIIKGEHMPDPLTDDSFRNFVSDPAFVKEVKAMKR
jgi:hypothetical protein